MSETLGSEKLRKIQEVYQKIESMFDEMENDPDHPDQDSPRIYKRKVLADGSIIRIRKGPDNVLPTRSPVKEDPNALRVQINRDEDVVMVAFTMFPESMRLHDLAMPSVKLGDIEVGFLGLSGSFLSRYPQQAEAHYRPYKPNPAIQSTAPILVDWVHKMYTENKRVPLQFTAELS